MMRPAVAFGGNGVNLRCSEGLTADGCRCGEGLAAVDQMGCIDHNGVADSCGQRLRVIVLHAFHGDRSGVGVAARRPCPIVFGRFGVGVACGGIARDTVGVSVVVIARRVIGVTGSSAGGCMRNVAHFCVFISDMRCLVCADQLGLRSCAVCCPDEGIKLVVMIVAVHGTVGCTAGGAGCRCCAVRRAAGMVCFGSCKTVTCCANMPVLICIGCPCRCRCAAFGCVHRAVETVGGAAGALAVVGAGGNVVVRAGEVVALRLNHPAVFLDFRCCRCVREILAADVAGPIGGVAGLRAGCCIGSVRVQMTVAV